MIQRLHVQTSWAVRRSSIALSLERLKYRFFKFQTFWYTWVCFLFLLEEFSPFKPSVITYRVQTLAFSSINQKRTTENPHFWLTWTQQIQAQNNRPLSINGVDWLQIIEVNAHLLMFSFIFSISMPWGSVLLPDWGLTEGTQPRLGKPRARHQGLLAGSSAHCYRLESYEQKAPSTSPGPGRAAPGHTSIKRAGRVARQQGPATATCRH